MPAPERGTALITPGLDALRGHVIDPMKILPGGMRVPPPVSVGEATRGRLRDAVEEALDPESAKIDRFARL